jgi:hypothetical protein
MAIEILTPEEFADRLKIGRSTLFEWIAKDILVCGKHYFKQGRILRFIWSEEVILSLLESSARSVEAPPAVTTSRTHKAGTKPSINWDY